jgi:hypothetical protein
MKFWNITTSVLFIALLAITTACQSGQKETTDTPNQDSVANTQTAERTPPTQFASLQEMMDDLGDYSNFEVISDSEVQVSSALSATADDSQIEKVIKGDIVKVAYRAFIHTQLEKVTVTTVVSVTTPDGENKEQERKLTVERQKALDALKSSLQLEDFAQLVGDYMGELFRPDKANDNFNSKLLEQNLDAVYNQLQPEA